MLIAAFTSRSWVVPHAWHVHSRTCSGLGPSLTPHAEHSCEEGKNRSTFANVRPDFAALYSSVFTKPDQPASCTDFAIEVRARPFTARSST
ncbi:MAG: hypothetical protein JWN00_2171 [Actinomycetia bacterium]|nr:hypothetical protein [Actinomycetes bacterium]